MKPKNHVRAETSIEHQSHSVPSEIAGTLDRYREYQLAETARQNDIATLSRPSREERKLIAEARDAMGQVRTMAPEATQKLRELNRKRFDRIREKLNQDALKIPLDIHIFDFTPVQPGPTDPTFWWARTDWWFPEHVSAGMDSEGLKFDGGVTTHDGDLHFASFGAVALFELQADRIPMSLSRRWLSTPHVELFGGLLGHTGDNDIFTGDLWSKCWLHCDQQLFQWGFGENGPVPVVLGQAHATDTLIFEENGDRSVHVDLPGFKLMPPVTFTTITPGESVWARLEIRFDIQTEGAGTLLWLDPRVLLRTFQWPLTPL
jgi:hypothetical protein